MKTIKVWRVEIRHKKYRGNGGPFDVVATNCALAIAKATRVAQEVEGMKTGYDAKSCELISEPSV